MKDSIWIIDSRAKVDGYEFTRLLPPPKGSGFPPTTTERIVIYEPNFGALAPVLHKPGSPLFTLYT